MVGSPFHSTTTCVIERDGEFTMVGDDRTAMGEFVVMKGTAKKARRIYDGEVVVGFAGSVADAFTLEERFEGRLSEYNGNLQRVTVELAREWRIQQSTQKLKAMLIVINGKEMLLTPGIGEIITPDDGVLAIGSRKDLVLAVARAVKNYAQDNISAKEITENVLNIVADIYIFTNHNTIVEEL